MLSWSPVEGALMVAGSRPSAISTAWRQVPPSERTPARRKLVIALVDHVREHYETTGRLSPNDGIEQELPAEDSAANDAA